MRRGLLLILALGPWSGCSRERDASDELDRVESPVPVRLVRVSTRVPNLGLAPGDGATATLKRQGIAIALDPPVEQPIGCVRPQVQVAVAEDRRRYAFRCQPDEAWDLVYLWRGERVPWFDAMGSGHPWLRADGFPDWARIPDLPGAARQLLLEANPDPRHVFDAVREAGGTAALTELLSATPAMRYREPLGSGPPDPWLTAVATLGGEERARVLAALRATLATSGTGSAPAARALASFAPEDDSIADDLAARLTEIEAAARRDRRFGEGVRWRDEALRRLMRLRPEAAAAIGCARLSARDSATPLAREAAALGRCPHL